MELMELAYSYLRFSSPQQQTGDSIRRQTKNREDWLADHPKVQLDQSLVMTDRGRSAFRRKNWDAYALAQFVVHIKSGRVKPGSYLLVENLDRLSREDAGEATELFLSIVNKGIIVVQLSPVVMEFRCPVNVQSLMFAIVELSRGHSESAMKSKRLGSAWAQKKACAQARKPQPPAHNSKVAGTAVVTHRLPGWIEEKDGKPVVIPERVDVVRRIFNLALDGCGSHVIARKLNREKVPPLGRKTFKGKPIAWSKSTVYYLLTSRTVLGEYQPGTGHGSERKPSSDAVQNYYPAIIEPGKFDAVQGILKTRATVGRGRHGRHVNLFAGLLVDARDGGSLTYRHSSVRPPTLVPVGIAQARGSKWTSFPSNVFEDAIVKRLIEVKACDVVGKNGAVGKVDALRGEIEKVKSQIQVWYARMDNTKIADLVEAKLTEYHGQLETLNEKLREAQREASSPLSESWGEFRSLGGLLDKDKSDELRTKVQFALRRSIESILCLFMGRGDWRLAAVQVWFTGGERHRDYVICYAPPKANGQWHREGKPYIEAFPSVAGRSEYDLRKPEDVRELEAELLAMPLNPS